MIKKDIWDNYVAVCPHCHNETYIGPICPDHVVCFVCGYPVYDKRKENGSK